MKCIISSWNAKFSFMKCVSSPWMALCAVISVCCDSEGRQIDKASSRLTLYVAYLCHSLTQENWDSGNTENIKQERHKFLCLPYTRNQWKWKFVLTGADMGVLDTCAKYFLFLSNIIIFVSKSIHDNTAGLKMKIRCTWVFVKSPTVLR